MALSAGARTISVRFDANTASDMPWAFKPKQVTDTVQIGQRDMAVYEAKNLSSVPITGSATFSVEPRAGRQVLQQDPVLLLYRADAAARAGSDHAGALLRRSQGARRSNMKRTWSRSRSATPSTGRNSSHPPSIDRPAARH